MGILKLFASDTPVGQATPIHYDEATTLQYRRQVTERLAAEEAEQQDRGNELRQKVEQLRAQGLPIRRQDLIAYLCRQTRVEARREAGFA